MFEQQSIHAGTVSLCDNRWAGRSTLLCEGVYSRRKDDIIYTVYTVYITTCICTLHLSFSGEKNCEMIKLLRFMLNIDELQLYRHKYL